MYQKNLKIEQVIMTGFLLGFDKISSYDISALVEDIESKFPKIKIDDYSDMGLSKYIKTKADIIFLKDNINLNTLVDANGTKRELKDFFSGIIGSWLRQYVNIFNMEEFLFRKIDLCSDLNKVCVNQFFCKKQCEGLQDLSRKGYLTLKCVDCFDEFLLSDSGKLAMFKSKYSYELADFLGNIRSLGYNDNLLDDFLMSQDLDRSIYSVLDLEKFKMYILAYNKAHGEKYLGHSDFVKFQFNVKNMSSMGQQQLLKYMLGPNSKDHFIYVISFNNGLRKIFDRSHNWDQILVNWNNIRVNRVLKENAYMQFSALEYKEAIKYTYDCLRFGNFYCQMDNDLLPRYLIILEQYKVFNESNYLIRGIMKADKNNYYMAFNPEYREFISSNTVCTNLELRKKESEVPMIYRLRRNNK